MFGKISLVVLIAAICVFYLKFNESFYHLCRKSVKDENYLNNFFMVGNITNDNEDKRSDKILKIQSLCEDFYVDYSSHVLMKLTLGNLDNMVYGNKNYEKKNITDFIALEDDEKIFMKNLENLNVEQIKLSLYLIKFIHILLYCLVLYLVIISFSNVAARIILSIFDKLLIFIFLIFVMEGILNFYTPIQIDLLANFSPKLNLLDSLSSSDREMISKSLDFFPLNVLRKWFTNILGYIFVYIN